MRISARAQRIEPFYAVEMGKVVAQLQRPLTGVERPMVYLTAGEPDFTAPPLVREAATRAVRNGMTQYTPAIGLVGLRERISDWYKQRFGVEIPARRIAVTAGASAALQLACLALIEAGDEVLMSDPSYPCSRHFISAAEGRPILVPTNAYERYQLNAQRVQENWGAKTRAVLLVSPSNPAGTSIDLEEIRRIHTFVQAHGGTTLVDEIYLGLSHDDSFGKTALSIDENVVSINSFSKYFSMTGWRIGWLVAPEAMIPVIERLAQNLFLCPSSIAQHAALACFEPDSILEYERRRDEFKARRDWFIPALNEIGFDVPALPDGAFYAWADCSSWLQAWGVSSSWEFALDVMKRARVAISPGRDFGKAETSRYVRLSMANSMENLEEAITRLERLRPR